MNCDFMSVKDLCNVSPEVEDEVM